MNVWLYVSFGSKLRPSTFWCVAMRSAVGFFFVLDLSCNEYDVI